MDFKTEAKREYPYVGMLKDDEHTTVVYFIQEREGVCLSSTDELNTSMDGRYSRGWDEDKFVPIECNMNIEEPKLTDEEIINNEAVNVMNDAIAFIQADKVQVYDIKAEVLFDTIPRVGKSKVPNGFKKLTILLKDK